ncbi:MAG TPA: M20/M25/M40 family metallo-hydrolase [Spirochaetia bacterium]|nr:M20/M25/M40 family metallo-hydrolase [Spirochaetia bacterium]
MGSTRVLEKIRGNSFLSYLSSLLMELCAIDTTPDADIALMGKREGAAFEVIERELKRLVFAGAAPERRPINPKIKDHPAYSLLHYTKTPARPEGLMPEEAYSDRSNLLYIIPGTGAGDGRSLALNAHIDVVAPFFPPRLENGSVVGRGACDDKGSVVAILAALKVLSEFLQEEKLSLARNLICMFVVEEEPGGNGSLSLALDGELKRLYESVLVMETAENRIYPANRGALWYRCELSLQGTDSQGADLLEMASFVIQELEREGRGIRAESRHPLFPTRPVQTCHGIIGPYGEHPSRICGEVVFKIALEKRIDDAALALIRDCLDYGVEDYCGLYGDRTKIPDTATGKPKVDHHYDLARGERELRVSVHGSTGHMGAMFENDGAITKTAWLVQALARSRERIEREAGPMRLSLEGHEKRDSLVLEGGQGFVPTHRIEEIMKRIAGAARLGVQAYLDRIAWNGDAEGAVRTTFEKLHNDAYEGSPDSPSMKNGIAAARACGMWKDLPVTGWAVSCDARLFANQYPGMSVLTSGPGYLHHAHSDAEQLSLDELRKSVEFLALYILKETGTLKDI